MHLSTTITYPATPDVVSVMLSDADFARDKITDSGSLAQTVDVAHERPQTSTAAEVDSDIPTPPGSFRVATRRAMPADDLPANMRAMVGKSIEIRQVEAWEEPDDDGTRAGTMTVEILGAPIRFVGTMTLTPDPTTPGGSTETVEGDLKASVPLFGATIEQTIAPQLLQAMEMERVTGLRWLAAHSDS